MYVECIVFACVKMTAKWTEDAVESIPWPGVVHELVTQTLLSVELCKEET